jgi:DNA-binding transcriptional MerR regulator
MNSKIEFNLHKETNMEKSDSSSPLYNIGVVTRVTGVSISTLHAWERRYGFPGAARTDGGHRLYSEKDIARLRWVKSQLNSGMNVSRAVVAVRLLEAGHLFYPKEAEEKKAAVPELSNSPSLRDSLMEALFQHNIPRADQLMGEMLAFYSPDNLTLDVIGPALNAIGEAWEHGEITVATEHLASNFLRHRLLMWMVTGPAPKPGNPILLACAPGEWHEGSLLILGVLLRRQGWPIAYLGQNVPFPDLAKFIDQIQPVGLILVAMGEEAAHSLFEWPQWIKQVGGQPVVTFGGRAFVNNPDLQVMVPGQYLGDSIKTGLTNLVSIIQREGK